MSAAYFINNTTKSECAYVKNTGTYTLEIETVVTKVCQMKKWDTSDTVIVMLMDSKNMTRYIYKDNRFELCFKEDSKYDFIEIETDENEVCEDNYNFDEEYDEDEYEIEDDYYDERDDYDERDYDCGYGYEDEFYECCDIY